jgi:hypothetical protein
LGDAGEQWLLSDAIDKNFLLMQAADPGVHITVSLASLASARWGNHAPPTLWVQ